MWIRLAGPVFVLAGAASCQAAPPPNATTSSTATSSTSARAIDVPPPAHVTPLPPSTSVPAVPLDLPTAAEFEQIPRIMTVELRKNGTRVVDGREATDDELEATARRVCADPSVRVILMADSMVTHGRVIQALDLLKQGGCVKIAFGVQPAPAP